MPRIPVTFWAGAAIIAACEVLLWSDVRHRGVAVLPALPHETALPPQGAAGEIARWVAVHMTPLCWVGYLLVFDGVLQWRERGRGATALPRSGTAVQCGTAGPAAPGKPWHPGKAVALRGLPPRKRPRRFLLCAVTSVVVWSYFDWVNFSFIHAWEYHGLAPLSLADVLVSKFVAFAAISPAMFVTAALYQDLGCRRIRTRPIRIGGAWQAAMLIAGIAFVAAPFLLRDPVACFSLWVSLVLLLDPINHWIGRADRAPSLIGDWQAGRWGRTVALAAAGLTCGVLWEFWNYWAAGKWTYTLPFLGPLERYRLFEMPLAGFAGFLPFALECWVAFNFILAVLDRLGLRFAEALPDRDTIL